MVVLRLKRAKSRARRDLKYGLAGYSNYSTKMSRGMARQWHSASARLAHSTRLKNSSYRELQGGRRRTGRVALVSNSRTADHSSVQSTLNLATER